MIKLMSLNKYYEKNKPNEVHALNSIDFEVKPGELLAIMGASGSGKSTLLNVVGCMDAFDSGSYLLDGVDVGTLNEKKQANLRCQRIGFVFQDFAVIDDETVLENVKIPLYFDKSVPLRTMNKKAQTALDRVHIGDLSKRNVNQLSGGQKQRVAIARSIVNDPAIILADEPTGALDSVTSQQIMDLFIELNKMGKTIIVVTHNLDIANQCDRIIYIKDGKI
jgi:putative ABC transport system ATP-binding protein